MPVYIEGVMNHVLPVINAACNCLKSKSCEIWSSDDACPGLTLDQGTDTRRGVQPTNYASTCCAVDIRGKGTGGTYV